MMPLVTSADRIRAGMLLDEEERDVAADLPEHHWRRPGFDAHRLYRALDAKRDAAGLSWRGVARAAHVPHSLIGRLAAGQHPSADVLVRLLVWLGTTDVAPYITGEVPDGLCA